MTKLLNRMDKVLLILTLIMFIFGLFLILDSSSMKSFMEYGNNARFFYKQLVVLIVSLVLSFFMLFIPIKTYKKGILFACGGLILFLVYLLLYGKATSGANSWIYIGPFGVQPSEFCKIAVILFSAIYYRANLKYLNKFIPSIIPPFIGAIMTGLVTLQPDAGTGIVLFFLTVLLFLASPVAKKIKLKAVLIFIIFIILLSPIVYIFRDSILTGSQMNRFNFLKPCTRYQEDTGYQVCNGYIAINNGKLLSIIPGNSQQKYAYLPEAFTDFIFPILVDEFGLITGILVILIYMIIIIRCIVLAKKSVNTTNALICYGVGCFIFLHVVINLVGVLGLLPLTGIPLPFISYGGSFALSISISLALVQRVSIENYNYLQKKVLEN